MKTNLKKPRATSSSKRQARGAVLSRQKALRRIQQLLAQEKGLLPEAIRLIDQFCFHTDDLTEAGISYEMVRAIEKRHPLLLQH